MEPVTYPSALTDRDRAVFASAGFGRVAGLGTRPAVLVVDVTYRFCGEEPQPILEAVKHWRTSCGEEAWEAIRALAPFLHRCRDREVPIYLTRGWQPREDGSDLGRWSGKSDRISEDLSQDMSIGNTIVQELGPGPGDVVITKGKPSAFFGTPLLSFLIERGIDTLLVCGTTTSGCVRATVVDAFSYNFRVGVIAEGTFDRGQASHEVSLFDMDQKYADVMPIQEVDHYLDDVASSPARTA